MKLVKVENGAGGRGQRAGEGGLVSGGVRFTSSSFRRRSHE